MEMYKYNVGQAQNIKHDLICYFALTIHENPTVPVLIALVEKYIDLTIRKDVAVIDIKGSRAFFVWDS